MTTLVRVDVGRRCPKEVFKILVSYCPRKLLVYFIIVSRGKVIEEYARF